MTTALRLACLALVLAAAGGAIWLLARASRVDQPMSLSVAVDRVTEGMETADRVGKLLTRMTHTEEVQIGEKIAAQVEARHRRLPDSVEPQAAAELARREAYLNHVLTRLVADGGLRRPEIPYNVKLLPGAPNAYALPGGWIYVTDSLFGLVENEAELVAILGHEIAHVDLRHCIERIQYQVQIEKVGGERMARMLALGVELWQVGYSGEQEAEADRQGTLYAERVGYHPQAVVALFERLEQRYRSVSAAPREGIAGEVEGMLAGALEDYFASHPPIPERLTNLERAWREQRLDLEGRSYYLGRENRRLLVPKGHQEFPQEWVTGRLWLEAPTSPATL